MGEKSSLKFVNPQSLRALMVDDSENDVLLIIRELKKGGYNPFYERVETAAAMRNSLQEKQWDIILCDYKMPKFDAPSAIALLKKTKIDIPLIIISGTIGEETAVECMRLGAHDYFMKANLSRLCPAIARELEEAKARSKQKQAETEREAALEALHRSEEKYRTIIENIEEGYFEIDLAGNFTFFNDSTCRCYGYPPEELMGINYKKYTDKENAKKLFKIFNETYSTGTTSRLLEYEIIRKDGSKRRLEGFVSLQKDSSGNPVAFRGTTRDITERKHTEKKLKESEERYRALFDRSLDIIYTIDFDGNFIDANTTALNRFGYTREELPLTNVASLMDEDQLPFALKVMQEIKKYGVQKDLLEIRLRHKDGTPVYVETKGSAVISNGKAIAIQQIARDITGRKAAEQKLLQSEKYFKEITENSSDIIIITDTNGNIKYCSRSIERFSGYTPEELIGKSGFSFIHPDDLERAVNVYSTAILLQDTAIPNGFRMIHKDGSERYLEGLGKNLLNNPDVAGFIMNVHDATESRQAEEKLKESEKKYRLITEKMTDIVWILDMNLRTIYVTPSVQNVLGFTQEERMSQTVEQQLTPESLSIAVETMAKELALEEHGQRDDERIVTLELEYYHKDGSTRWIETIMSGLRNDQGVLDKIHGVSRDVTKRKKVEAQREAALEALRKSEELYTKLVNAIPDIIVQTDLKGNIVFINDYALQISGYSREELEGYNLFLFIAPEDHEYVIKNLLFLFDGRKGSREYHLIAKDGRKVPFEVNGDILRNKDGTPFGIVNLCRDITERKLTEKILLENEERLRGITGNLPGIIFQFYAKDNGEYGMNYVSERQTEFLDTTENIDDLFPSFISQIHEYDKERFLDSIKNAVEKAAPWNFEGRVTIRTGETIWFQGLATPTRHEDQLVFDGIILNITERKMAEEKSRLSEEKFHKIFMTAPDCITISRLKDGLIIDVNKGFEDILGWKSENVIGLKATDPPHNLWVDASEREFMVTEMKGGRNILHREFEFRRSDGSAGTGTYSARPINIAGEECLIFILQDITEHKHMDAELRRTLDSLRKAFGVTMKVMVSAVEMRDPYTAGHQLKTADIARAIATEMGLSQEQIDGIRIAGTIHDIGKLSIPAEILSKPTKLTELEFSLIKEHSHSGYEMLKDVESPWPLAEIVYQHHERMDGTGYPRNLKGDEILIEARILAVADVVEAMASHRPYRASLGIEAALQEIEKNKGVLYDIDVADACLRLFSENKYQFS